MEGARMPEGEQQEQQQEQQDQFRAPKDQAEFDRMVQDRIRRAETKAAERFANYDELKTKAAKFDEVEQSKKDDVQKLTERAEAAEQRAALSEQRYTRQQAQAALTTAIAGRDVPPTAFIGLDLDQFVKNGAVDADAITTYANGFPEAKTTTSSSRTTFGQGRRESVETKPGDRGRAEAERRFGGTK